MYEVLVPSFITIGGVAVLGLILRFGENKTIRKEEDLINKIKSKLNLDYSDPKLGYLDWKAETHNGFKYVSIPAKQITINSVTLNKKNELENILLNTGFNLDLFNIEEGKDSLTYKSDDYICKIELDNDSYENSINSWLKTENTIDIVMKIAKIEDIL